MTEQQRLGRKRKVIGAKREKCVALLRAGVSSGEIGRRLELAKSTVEGVRAQEGIAAPRSLKGIRKPPPKEPTPVEPDAAELPLDPVFAAPAGSLEEEIERLNRQRARIISLGEAAEKDGNTAVASGCFKNAAAIGNTLVRIRQKMHESSGGGVTFTRDELEAARRNVRDKVTSLLASPEVQRGVCSSCGEKIRINWSEGRES